MPGSRANADLGYITWTASLNVFVEATTLEPTDITSESAVLNGEVDWAGDEVVVQFEARPLGGDYTVVDEQTYTESGTIQHDFLLEGLSEGSTYTYRFRAERDNEEEDIGDAISFDTKLLLEGTVDIDGSGVDGAKVYVSLVDPPDDAEVIKVLTTESDGSFDAEVEPFPDGEYHVAAQHEDGEDQYAGESKPFVGDS